MSKPDKVTVALTKLLDNTDPALVATAASKLTDLRVAKMSNLKNENKVGPLRDEISELKKRLATADALLSAMTAEKDALAAQIAELRPLAERLPAVEGELAELKASNDQWKAEQVKLLTADAQTKLFKAEATLRAAEEKVREADNTVSTSGWTELRATLAELISRHSIPMPNFWETPSTMPSAFWTLWGWSQTRAKVYTAYKRSYDSPTDSFKQQVFRILTAGLPTFPVVRQQFDDDGDVARLLDYTPQTEIPDLGERRECLMEMATRFNCLVEIQRQVEQRQIQIIGHHLQQNASDLQAQQLDMSRRGYGRQGQVQPEQSATGVPLSEHILGCECPVCSGGISRRTSLDPIEEIA